MFTLKIWVKYIESMSEIQMQLILDNCTENSSKFLW